MKASKKKCNWCQNNFEAEKGAIKYCSDKCNRAKRNDDAKKRSRRLIIEKNKNDLTMVKCELCEMRSHDLTKHINSFHNISCKEYTKKYNKPFRSEKYTKNSSEMFSGEKNPGYNHGGKFSPFSKKFVNYSGDEYIKKLAAKAQKTREDNDNETTKLSYYTSRGYSEEESIKLLSERQRTFSRKICRDKYGDAKGDKIWRERQEKWLKSFPNSNYSKVSQKLFNDILDNLDKKFIKNNSIFFAEYNNGNKCLESKNYECRLALDDGSLIPDFLVLETKKIIEFYGTYWHGEVGRGNKERDRKRIERYLRNGYTPKIVWEHDYKEYKEKIIKECVEFLNE